MGNLHLWTFLRNFIIKLINKYCNFMIIILNRLNKTVIYDNLKRMDKKTPIKTRTQHEEHNGSSNMMSDAHQLSLLRKKPWTEEEDMLVKSLVEKYGPQRWSFIAKFVTGRLGKQCRQRWHNHLNPSILKVEWAIHE